MDSVGGQASAAKRRIAAVTMSLGNAVATFPEGAQSVGDRQRDLRGGHPGHDSFNRGLLLCRTQVFRFATTQKDSDGGGSVRSMVHQGKTIVVVTIQAAGNGSHVEIKTLDKDTRN